MSREYTFDTTLRKVTKEDVDNVAERLIDAERMVVGPDFYNGDYVLLLGAYVGIYYYPGARIHGIDICCSNDIVPTRIVLRRRNTLKNTINSVYCLNSALRDVRNKQDLIKDVIFNNPATIVYWVDGTKTVVKAHNEKFDPEKGLAMAICKRFLGSNKSGSNFNNIFKKWLPEQKESNSDTNIKDYEKNEPLRWMTVAEVAEELGCSKALVQEECRKGLYPGAFKENGKWLIPVPLLEEKRGNKNE